MLESFKGLFKKRVKIDEDVNEVTAKSKEAAKQRLHLVLMQDRANVSVDFLDMMKQEIIDVIKKYIDVDESEMDVRITNKQNEDGTNGAPALYANIPIISIKNDNSVKKVAGMKISEISNLKKTMEEKNEIKINSVSEDTNKENNKTVIQVVKENSKKEKKAEKNEENNNKVINKEKIKKEEKQKEESKKEETKKKNESGKKQTAKVLNDEDAVVNKKKTIKKETTKTATSKK